MEKYLRSVFEEVLNTFDFEKSEMIMNFLGWKWYGNDYTPSVNEIRKCVKELFEQCLNSFIENDVLDAVSWSSGGYEVRISSRLDVSIKFIAVQSFSY